MATSNSTNFEPNVAEFIEEAYERWVRVKNWIRFKNCKKIY